jgi:hypothetical protein
MMVWACQCVSIPIFFLVGPFCWLLLYIIILSVQRSQHLLWDNKLFLVKHYCEPLLVT